MEHIPTIGLEIHAELKTNSKMFCSCANDPDEIVPNKNVCSICLGHPGTLPVLNFEAIKHVLKIGIAVDGKLADFTEWDRKNYFYPDIPKGYQISQYAYPLVSGGKLAGIELERIHLEEDTAQSTHDTHEKSLINFNRSGVPLLELVTKPVIHDAETAVKFARELQLLLRYLGAGEANMEKGEMRVEANISVAPILQGLTSEQSDRGTDLVESKLGTKTEVKNLNSFKAVQGAIAYEIKRQIALLEAGEKVKQETRGWKPEGQTGDGQEKLGITYSQRSKESSHDYRYFPEPDIPKLKISEIPEFSVDTLKRELKDNNGSLNFPWIRREHFKNDYNMTDKEVDVFVTDDTGVLAAYFELIISKLINKPDKAEFGKKVRLVTNYLLTDYAGLLKKVTDSKTLINSDNWISKLYIIKPEYLSEIAEMLYKSSISSTGAKKILSLLVIDNVVTDSILSLAEKHDLIQKSNLSDLEPIIDKIVVDNATVVAEYRAGKISSLQFLIGQTMKATKGSANPAVIKELLIKKLG